MSLRWSKSVQWDPETLLKPKERLQKHVFAKRRSNWTILRFWGAGKFYIVVTRPPVYHAESRRRTGQRRHGQNTTPVGSHSR